MGERVLEEAGPARHARAVFAAFVAKDIGAPAALMTDDVRLQLGYNSETHRLSPARPPLRHPSRRSLRPSRASDTRSPTCGATTTSSSPSSRFATPALTASSSHSPAATSSGSATERSPTTGSTWTSVPSTPSACLKTKARLSTRCCGAASWMSGGDLAVQRPYFESFMRQIPLPDGLSLRYTTLGGVPVLELGPPGVDGDATILYFHGGAFALGSPRAGARLAADLGRQAGVRVVSVDSRLAPEHRYPAAVRDALAAYRGLLAKTPSAKIAFVRAAAGGSLAPPRWWRPGMPTSHSRRRPRFCHRGST
jgi:hypothetical protein